MRRITMLLAILMACATQACAALHSAPGSKLYPDVGYVEHATTRQRFDLAVPPSADGKPLPLIVYVHGGAWKAGTRELCPLWAMTKHGYAVATIDYRYSTDAIWPAQIDDCRAALQYLADHAETYGIDPARIALAGDSAGGHLVLMLGLAANDGAKSPTTAPTESAYQIRCVVDYYGPTDFTHLAGPFPGGNPIDQLLGGKIENHLKLAAAASPVTYIDKSDPPVFVVHGDNDKIVPVSQSQEFSKMMKAAGATCELTIIPGAGHGGPSFAARELTTRINAFFDRYEKK